jgi:hypothetical protein
MLATLASSEALPCTTVIVANSWADSGRPANENVEAEGLVSG